MNYKLRLRKPRVTAQRLRFQEAAPADLWCVTTELGTWTMRQGDMIMLTGNSMYGGGIATLSAQMGVSEPETRRVIDALNNLLPQYTEWSCSMRQAVQRGHTQFQTYSGRVIHLQREFPHKAPNFAIQGSARELLVDALIRWRDTRWGRCTVFPVHDELDVFVPAEDADEATRELVRCMEMDLFGVKIIADPSKPAFAWADSA